jgi:hypothetical protein
MKTPKEESLAKMPSIFDMTKIIWIFKNKKIMGEMAQIHYISPQKIHILQKLSYKF